MKRLVLGLICLFLVFWGNAFCFENYINGNSLENHTDISELSKLGALETLPERFANSGAIGFCNMLNGYALDFDYFTMQLDMPQYASSQHYVPFFATVCTLCFDGNLFWGIEGNGYRLFSIDPETVEYKVYGLTEHFTVIDYSTIERQLYGATLDGQIYKIDRFSQETELFFSTGLMIGGGCIGNDNNLYCLEANGGDFMRINLSNGTAEMVFSTSQQYFHPMGFACDRFTGLIYYWRILDNNNSLCMLSSYNPEDDILEEIGYLPGNSTCSAFCIPSWIAEENTPMPVSFCQWNSDVEIELSWINPSETVNGDCLQETLSIEIYCNDELVETLYNQEPGANSCYTHTPASAGQNIFTIKVLNSSGTGASKDVFSWFGEDSPGKVQDIIITRNNDQISIDWQMPVEGMHGGEWQGNIDSYLISMIDGTNISIDGSQQSYSYSSNMNNMIIGDITANNLHGEGLSQSTPWIENTSANPKYIGNYETPIVSSVIPFNSTYYNGMNETVYSADYIRQSGLTTGAITALGYQIMATEIPWSIADFSVQIYLGETDREDLIDSWILAEDLQLVYEGFPDIDTDTEELVFELNAPYIYNGRNLVVMIYKEPVEDWFLTYTVITDMYEHEGCGRNIYQMDNWLPPFNFVSPWETTATSIAPNLKIFHAGSELPDLSGVITNSITGHPIEGVRVTLSCENGNTQSVSGFNGSYNFPHINTGEWNIDISQNGYCFFSDNLLIEEVNEVHDIHLIPANLINVTGQVIHNTGGGVANAEIRLSGAMEAVIYSGDDGYFSFEEIYGINDYCMEIRTNESLSAPFYFRADSIDMDIGSRILPEQTYCVENVSAEIIPSRAVSINWSIPDTLLLMREDFDFSDGGFNSDFGWGWGSDSLVINTYGEKLWGTALNSKYGFNCDYKLDSPEIYLDSPGYELIFSMYMITNYSSGGNLKISTDEGMSWEMIYPEEGYSDTMFCSNCNFEQEVFTGCIYNWTDFHFDLSEYANEMVMIRFQFGTSYSNVLNIGWYIDNVRIIKDNSNRDLQSYRVIKGTNLSDISDWELIATGITSTSLIDDNWQNTQYPGKYYYAIQAEYDGGILSKPAFCSPLSFGANYDVDFDLIPDASELISSSVKISPVQGIYSYSQNTQSNSISFNEVWNGMYEISINSMGYFPICDTITIHSDTLITCQLESYLYPIDGVTINEETGFLEWECQYSDQADHFKIYLDNEEIYKSDSLDINLNNYDLFENGEDYTIGVSAQYGFFESEMISTEFTCNFIPVDDDENTIVGATCLKSVYPNPFNPSAVIKYSIEEAGNVEISIYNTKGQKVTTLINETRNSGEYESIWNADSYASGIFFIRFKSGKISQTTKITLLK